MKPIGDKLMCKITFKTSTYFHIGQNKFKYVNKLIVIVIIYDHKDNFNIISSCDLRMN